MSNTSHLIGNVATVITRNDYHRSDGEILTKIRFLLAADKDLRPRADGRPWPADFIPVEVWGPTARAVVEHNGKGSRLAVRGRLKSEFYKPEGAEKGSLQMAVVAEKVDFLSPRRTDEGEASATDNGETVPDTPSIPPAARSASGGRR